MDKKATFSGILPEKLLSMQHTSSNNPASPRPAFHSAIIIIMSDIILEVEKLIKNYGSFRAVDGISFTIPKGKVIGFLGPNGAGKTTTIHMLLGITLSNGGTIKYFGKSFFQHRLYCLQRINFTSAFNTLLGRIPVQ